MVSEHRPIADGFRRAPVIEAIIDVVFKPALSAEQFEAARELLISAYEQASEQKSRRLVVNEESVTIGEGASTFRFESNEGARIALLRPDGYSAVQLAPYECWENLFERFSAEASALFALQELSPVRIASRFVNRIDVPVVGGKAHYEEYLGVHIHVPDAIASVGPFQLGFLLYDPADNIKANIQSAVLEQAVENAHSFTLDIDVYIEDNLPERWEDCLNLYGHLRDKKNHYYRTFLTEKALEEYE